MSSRKLFNIPQFLPPRFVPRPIIDQGGPMQFQTLYTAHDTLAKATDSGPMFNREGQMLSYARKYGETPDCTPAPHDKTFLEDLKIRPKSDIDLWLLAMDNFCEGNYTGTYHYWSEYWDRVKEEHGIGHNVYPGMA